MDKNVTEHDFKDILAFLAYLDDPEMFAFAVTDEVRRRARELLARVK